MSGRGGGPHADDEPRSMADAVERVRAQLGIPAAGSLAALEAGWAELVGPQIAAHARLTGVRDGALVVTVDATPWASELRYLESMILARVRVVLGDDAVQVMRVRVGS